MYEFTKFEDIYKLFLGSIQDYHIRALFESDIDTAEDMLETFLKRGVSKFRNCTKDISDLDMVNKSFRVVLTIEEQNIITDLMLLSWLDYIVNDITQMNLSLNDNDWRVGVVIPSTSPMQIRKVA